MGKGGGDVGGMGVIFGMNGGIGRIKHHPNEANNAAITCSNSWPRILIATRGRYSSYGVPGCSLLVN